MLTYEEHLAGENESISGGELAASMSPATRMDMIQKGYNPLSPTDVQKYRAGQRPAEGLAHMAGKARHLGESHYSDQKDYSLMAKQGIDFDDLDNSLKELSPREKIQQTMESYGTSSASIDLSDRLNQRLNSNSVQKKSAAPIALPKTQSKKMQLLTEAAKAKKLGYVKGIKYLNSFISLIKNPTLENRQRMITELNQMVLVEERIHPNIINQYRAGIAQAEREMYQKLKSSNK